MPWTWADGWPGVMVRSALRNLVNLMVHTARWLRQRLPLVTAVATLCLPADPALAQSTHPNEGEKHAIRLNTIGYLDASTKQATLAQPGDEFVVRGVPSGEEVARGSVVALGERGKPSRRAYVADFSDVRRSGRFRVEVPGVGVSADFDVGSDIYNWPFYCCARAMYLWRCGTAVEGQFAGERFSHPACHMKDALLERVGGQPGEVTDGVGGWHDAGDYGKYTVNGAFTAGMLLLAWEHFPRQLAEIELDIPESGNDMPDLLDEVRWELEWLLKMQADDGRVYHKLTAPYFSGFIAPEADQAPRYFCPWGSAGTASFAAVMAQAARVYRPYDQEFADRCLAAAEKAYRFLSAHPEDHEPNQKDFSTGGYNAPDPDDRVWAAAELWETTGRPEYLRDFERLLPESIPKWHGRPALQHGEPAELVDLNWDWANVRNLGTFTYLLSSRPGRDPELLERVRQETIRVADAIVDTAQEHEYGRPLGDRYYWGCNGTVARQCINLNVADRLNPKPEYRATMLRTLDYLFGRNLYGRSLVTGLGDDPPREPHDRRSGSDEVEMPWPGYLVGGGWPTAADWHDDWEDYRTNEVAINWNGALIYALAAFLEPDGFAASIARERAASAGETER